jgi:hypothetical protein
MHFTYQFSFSYLQFQSSLFLTFILQHFTLPTCSAGFQTETLRHLPLPTYKKEGSSIVFTSNQMNFSIFVVSILYLALAAPVPPKPAWGLPIKLLQKYCGCLTDPYV